MTVQFYNQIEINLDAEQIFNYVTQPWCWCEWHPSSQSAHKDTDVLAVGDRFSEVIRLQPFDALALFIRKTTHYQVLISDPYEKWQVHGKMKGGELTITYQFKKVAGQANKTLFCRTLDYQVKGPYQLLSFMLNPKMEKMSTIAINNLKKKLEQ